MSEAEQWLDWLENNEDSPDFNEVSTAFLRKRAGDREFANEVNAILGEPKPEPERRPRRRPEIVPDPEPEARTQASVVQPFGTQPTERLEEPTLTSTPASLPATDEDELNAFERGLKSGKDYGDLMFGSALEGVGKKLGIESLVDYGLEVQQSNQTELDKIQGAMLTLDDVNDVGSFGSWAAQTVGQTLPLTATSIGAAILGAKAAPILGVSAGIAGLATAAGSQIPFFYGGNREAQKEAISQGLRTEMSEGAALLTAIPQATLDVFAEKLQLRGAADILGNLIKRDGGLLTRIGKGGVRSLGKGVVSEVPTEVGQLVLEKVQAGGLQSLNSDEFVDEVIETAAAAALVGESIGVTTGALGLDRSRYEAGIDEDARLARMSEEERNLLDDEIEEDMLADDAVDAASEEEIDAERERQRAEEKERKEAEETKVAAEITDEQVAQVTGEEVAGEEGIEGTVTKSGEGPEGEAERTDDQKVGEGSEEEVKKEDDLGLEEAKKELTQLRQEWNELTDNGTKSPNDYTDEEADRIETIEGRVYEIDAFYNRENLQKEKEVTSIVDAIEAKSTDTGTGTGTVAADETGAGPKVDTEKQDAPPVDASTDAPATTPLVDAELANRRKSLNARLNKAEKLGAESAIRQRTVKVTQEFLASDASKNLTDKQRATLQGKLEKLVSKPTKGPSVAFEKDAPKKTDETRETVTEVLEKAQKPVKGEAAANFAEASRIAGERKSEIALSDIEKKKYEEGLEFEKDVAGNIKFPEGTSLKEKRMLIQETEQQIKQSKKDLAKVKASEEAGLATPAPLLKKTTEKDFATDSDRVAATNLLKTQISKKTKKGNEEKARNYFAGMERVEDGLAFLAFDVATDAPEFTRSRSLTGQENALFNKTGGRNATEADAWVRENFDKSTVDKYESLKANYKARLQRGTLAEKAESSSKLKSYFAYKGKDRKDPTNIVRSLIQGEGYVMSAADLAKGPVDRPVTERREALTVDDKKLLAALEAERKRIEAFRENADVDKEEVKAALKAILEAKKRVRAIKKNLRPASRKIEKRTSEAEEAALGPTKTRVPYGGTPGGKPFIAYIPPPELKKAPTPLGPERKLVLGDAISTGVGDITIVPATLALPANLVSALNATLNPRIIQALRQGDLRLALGLLEGYADNVSKDSKDYFKFIQAIAETFPTMLGNTKVEIVNNLKNEAGVSVAGLFDPTTNTVKLDSERGLNTHVLLHELTHALTSATLGNKSNPVTKALKKLFEETRGLLDTTYGTSSLDEFVAEAFSNMEFRSKLAALYPKNSASSAFTKFKNQVLRMLNTVLTKVNIKAIELDPEVDASETILSNVGRLASAILAPAPESRNATELAADPEKIVDNLESIQDQLINNKGITQAGIRDRLRELTKSSSDQVFNLLMRFVDSADAAYMGRFFGEDVALKARELFETLLEQRGALDKKDKRIKKINAEHSKWYSKVGYKGKRLLDRLIYDINFGATITGVDPLFSKDQALAAYANDPTEITITEGKDAAGKDIVKTVDKMYIWNKQRRYVNELTKLKADNLDGMKVYTEMRDFYKQQYLDAEKSINVNLDNILGEDTASEVKKDLMSKLFDRKLLDVYFPLAREGKYKVVWHSMQREAEGKDPVMMVMVDTESQAKRLVKQLKADKANVDSTKNPFKGSGVAGPQYFEGEFDSKSFEDNSPANSTMTKILNKVDELPKTDETETLKENIMQLYLQTLPETSFAQAFQARKGTPGYIIDAKYAFNRKAYDIARQSTRIEYARKLRNIETDIGNLKYSADRDVTQSKFGLFKQRLIEDAQSGYNPPSGFGTRVSTLLNQFAFLQTISYNVSSAAIQTFQVPFIVYTALASKYGWGNATKAILHDASGLVLTSFDFGDSKIPEAGIDTYFDVTLDANNNEIYTLKEKHKKGLSPSKLKKLEDLAPLVKVAVDGNQLNRTFFADAMGLDESGRPIDGTTGKPQELWRNFMGLGATVFNSADRFNRQVSMVAFYQLELNKLRKGKKNAKLTEEQMIQAARDAVYAATETNGGTFIETGAPISKGNIGRVATMYKTYGFKMYFLLFKNFFNMIGRFIPPDAPNKKEIQKQAATMFMGNTLMTAAVLGVQSTFIYGAVKAFAALQDLISGEDENIDEKLRQAMTEGFYKGGLVALSGIDVTNRAQFNELLLQTNKYNTVVDPERFIFELFGGPAAGTAIDFYEGLRDVIKPTGNKVDLERGIEKMLPPAFSNMFKARGRLANEGYLTRSGNPVYEDVSQGELIFQFFGFAPAEYVRRTEEALTRRKIAKNIITRRSALTKQLNNAYSQNDMAEILKVTRRITKFNKDVGPKYPDAVILPSEEENSRKSFYNAKTNVYNGVSLPPKFGSDIATQIRFMQEAETED
tara:strand:- start:774 stop:7925 length:7152 start_codon:yes stop_codon:yes gene_type:complete